MCKQLTQPVTSTGYTATRKHRCRTDQCLLFSGDWGPKSSSSCFPLSVTTLHGYFGDEGLRQLWSLSGVFLHLPWFPATRQSGRILLAMSPSPPHTWLPPRLLEVSVFFWICNQKWPCSRRDHCSIVSKALCSKWSYIHFSKCNTEAGNPGS